MQQIFAQAEDLTVSAKERSAAASSGLSVRQREHQAEQSNLDAEIMVASQPATASRQEQAASVANLQTEIDTLRCAHVPKCVYACCSQ